MSSLGCKALCIVINFLSPLVYLPDFHPRIFKKWPRVTNRKYCPCVYPFDEISAAEYGFEKLSYSSEERFPYFHLYLCLILVSGRVLKIPSYLGIESGSNQPKPDEVKMVLYIVEECEMPCFSLAFTEGQMSIKNGRSGLTFFIALAEARR